MLAEGAAWEEWSPDSFPLKAALLDLTTLDYSPPIEVCVAPLARTRVCA